MGQLKFTITNQIIKRVDSFQPVAGSQNYLLADFEFDTSDWDGIDVKTAIFESGDVAYKVLIVNGSCTVPWEVLQNSGFVYVSVFGGDRITSNKAKVHITSTGYRQDAENETEPTTEVYDQIIGLINDLSHDVDGGLFTDWGDS